MKKVWAIVQAILACISESLPSIQGPPRRFRKSKPTGKRSRPASESANIRIVGQGQTKKPGSWSSGRHK